VQLVHDPQLAQETSAGQLLVLHSLSAFMTPEQPTPPGHVLSLLDFPPPQILLQLLQDPQFDHLTSAGQVLLLQSLVSVPSPVQPDPPLHERCLSDLPPPQLLLQLLQDPQLDQVTVILLTTVVGDVVVLEVAVIAESSFLMHVTPATSAMPQDLSAVWGQWRRWDSSPLHLRSLIANSVPTSTPPKCELVRATARLYPKILQTTSASL